MDATPSRCSREGTSFCFRALHRNVQSVAHRWGETTASREPNKNAAGKPDSKMKYKILVDITDGSSKPDTTNAYLEAVATLYNLHAVGGVSPENIDMVVVFHKMATYTALNDDEYQKKFKVNNPNTPLLKALADMGVKFFVCGQTMVRAKIPESGLNSIVKEATSALTTLTTYQLKGYAMINFK